MARRPVPPDLAEWQPVDQLAERVAALLPSTCAYEDAGAPWLPTRDVLARVLGIERADEARVTEANEHVGIYYLTVEARGPALQFGSLTDSVASTARAVRRGVLGGNL